MTDKIDLRCGDCLEVLASMPENSVDSCVTDPPYHLTSIVKRFGNPDSAPVKIKKIDGQGGSPFARGAKGFMGKQWDGGDIAFRPETWAAVLRVLKPGAHITVFGGTRTFHRMTCAIEDAGFEIRDTIMWLYGSGFPKSHDVSKGIDRAAGAERTTIGPNKFYHLNGAANLNVYGTASRPDETTPATAAARQWEGWGTALKPAVEPIILARKPLSEKTVAANVLRWGTGAINVDGCRIDSPDADLSAVQNCKTKQAGNTVTLNIPGHSQPTFNAAGRWPANVIHDGSEEVVAAFPDAKSAGEYRDPFPSKRRVIRANSFQEGFAQFTGGYWVNIITPEVTYPVRPDGSLCEPIEHSNSDSIVNFGNRENRNNFYSNETGSAARFFYTAKADSDDRIGSKHPTVKPLDLMQYLVRLITPKGGVVLDPFAGTGTTGEAAFREGMSAILIEREEEYQNDIRRRIALCMAGPDERRRETIKAKIADKPLDHGPLFGGR